MSNPKKPEHLKVLAGTDRPSRVNEPSVEFDPLVDIPQAPDWLPNAHAVKEWDRLVPILVVTKLLTSADLGTLAQLCALHGKIVQLYAAGESPGASMIQTLHALQSAFGLSPVARGKVAPAGSDDKKKNPFAGNGKKN